MRRDDLAKLFCDFVQRAIGCDGNVAAVGSTVHGMEKPIGRVGQFGKRTSPVTRIAVMNGTIRIAYDPYGPSVCDMHEYRTPVATNAAEGFPDRHLRRGGRFVSVATQCHGHR